MELCGFGFRGRAEHVGAQVLARHRAACGGFDGAASVCRDALTLAPVAYRALHDAKAGCCAADAAKD